MEALSEPDLVSVPDTTRSLRVPIVVTAVAVTSVGISSDCHDPCPPPLAAVLLLAPAADDQAEISALDQNLAQLPTCRDLADIPLRVLVLILGTLAFAARGF